MMYRVGERLVLVPASCAVGGGRCAAGGRLTAAAWVVVDWHGRGDAAAG